MSLLRLTNGFTELTDPNLLDRSLFIHRQMSAATSVFPTPVPSMTVLKETCDEFQSAINAAADGSIVAREHKNIVKQNLVDLLHKLGYYVLFTSGGDRLIAIQSGFSLAKPGTPVVLQAPTGVKAELGNQSGQVWLSAKAAKGAKSYLHQYTTTPENEASWISMTPCTTVRCLISGLTPGVTYYFRIGAIGAKEQVMYSTVISKIVA